MCWLLALPFHYTPNKLSPSTSLILGMTHPLMTASLEEWESLYVLGCRSPTNWLREASWVVVSHGSPIGRVTTWPWACETNSNTPLITQLNSLYPLNLWPSEIIHLLLCSTNSVTKIYRSRSFLFFCKTHTLPFYQHVLTKFGPTDVRLLLPTSREVVALHPSQEWYCSCYSFPIHRFATHMSSHTLFQDKLKGFRFDIEPSPSSHIWKIVPQTLSHDTIYRYYRLYNELSNYHPYTIGTS